jgi:hypothetical protein
MYFCSIFGEKPVLAMYSEINILDRSSDNINKIVDKKPSGTQM